MPDIVLTQDKEKHWVRYIKQRIKNNKNFIGFVGGPTGSGKSWCSLRIAEDIDPEFSIERVVFNGQELMKLINSKKLKSGSVIVFEEAGIEMSNRSWQSVMNKMLNFLMQTFRHRRFILIMNSPYMDFVDASTRKLFHAELQTCGINFNEGVVNLKPQLIQYNSRMQKFYYKYLKVIIPGQGVLPVKRWRVGKPSKELVNAYECKKREFTDALNKDIQAQLSADKPKHKRLFTCVNCGYNWYPRGQNKPRQCPSCKKVPT